MSFQIAVLRVENAMAKTLQSAVKSLERDKAQLQSRVNSLEQKLEGRQTGNREEVTSGLSAYLYLEWNDSMLHSVQYTVYYQLLNSHYY